MNKLKVYVVGNSPHYKMAVANSIVVTSIIKADLIIFTGGKDVSPDYYGEVSHITTRTNPQRDAIEKSIYLACKKHNKLCLGICRGAQFLTVMNGGKLIQHVSRHKSNHTITIDDEEYLATSTHHQMMYPFDIEHEMIGVASKKLSLIYQGGSEDYNPPVEPEIVYYPSGDLAVQPHLERQANSALWYKFNEILLQKLNEYEQSREEVQPAEATA